MSRKFGLTNFRKYFALRFFVSQHQPNPPSPPLSTYVPTSSLFLSVFLSLFFFRSHISCSWNIVFYSKKRNTDVIVNFTQFFIRYFFFILLPPPPAVKKALGELIKGGEEWGGWRESDVGRVWSKTIRLHFTNIKYLASVLLLLFVIVHISREIQYLSYFSKIFSFFLDAQSIIFKSNCLYS